jgi:hypothetical protein
MSWDAQALVQLPALEPTAPIVAPGRSDCVPLQARDKGFARQERERQVFTPSRL